MLDNKVLQALSYGVYLVSSFDKDRPVGCIVNCAMQLTQNLLGISMNKENYTYLIIKQYKRFAISILSEKINPEVISVFGFSTGRNSNKFEKVGYKVIDNLPVVEKSLGYLTLSLENEFDVDTHSLFVGKIISGELFNLDVPMTYKFYHDVIKGSAPKAAPTYIEPEKTSNQKRFYCTVCGYIYEGDINLEPPNYLCPVCKQPKSVFVPMEYA